MSSSVPNGSKTASVPRSATVDAKMPNSYSSDVIVLDDEPEINGRSIKTAKYPKIAKFAQNVFKKSSSNNRRKEEFSYQDDFTKMLMEGESGKLELQPETFSIIILCFI